MARPEITWTSFTRLRRPTRVLSGPMYNTRPVTAQASTTTAVAQWSARSAAVNRASSPSSDAATGLDRFVVAAVGPPDPGVDVVAPLLPVAGIELARHLDPLQPLERLVAVHGGDVEPDRAAVRTGDGLAQHLVGHEHVVAPGLVEREALGVRPVERPDAQVGGRRLDTGLVEELADLDALPRHVEHAPAGDALEVAHQVGLGTLAQVVERERQRPVDQAVDGEPVLGLAALREVPDHRVDAEAPGGGDERGEPRRIVLRDGPQQPLDAGLRGVAEQDAQPPEAEHAQHEPSADGRSRSVGIAAVPGIRAIARWRALAGWRGLAGRGHAIKARRAACLRPVAGPGFTGL